MSRLMSGHRSVTPTLWRTLVANDLARLRPCKSMKVAMVQAGGLKNLGCSQRDMRNFIDKERRLKLGKRDAKAIRKFVIEMQQKDRDFFYLIDVTDDSHLRNVMWIHPRGSLSGVQWCLYLSTQLTLWTDTRCLLLLSLVWTIMVSRFCWDVL